MKQDGMMIIQGEEEISKAKDKEKKKMEKDVKRERTVSPKWRKKLTAKREVREEKNKERNKIKRRKRVRGIINEIYVVP